MHNRSVPTNTLIPHLVYRSVPDAGAWLTRVFGFTEHFRYGDPVSGIQMRLGDAYLMLTGPRETTASPATGSPTTVGANTQFLTIMVPNVDAHHLHTQQEHVPIWEELHETVYGERQYGATDLDGHRWIFSQHVRDRAPEDWGATD